MTASLAPPSSASEPSPLAFGQALDDIVRDRRRAQSRLSSQAFCQPPPTANRSKLEFDEDDAIYREILNSSLLSHFSSRRKLNRWGEIIDDHDDDVPCATASAESSLSVCDLLESSDSSLRPITLMDSLPILRQRSTFLPNDSLSSFRPSAPSPSPSGLSLESFALDSSEEPRVSFGIVEVREYGLVVGDNPSCRGACALQLDWSYADSYKRDAVRYRRRRSRLQCLSEKQRRARVQQVNGWDEDHLRDEEELLLLDGAGEI